MVSGHVDGVAEIVERRDFDGMAHFTFRAPAALAKFIAVKGSVALDGVSLTVNAVDGDRVRGAADSAHARSDDAERLEGRRPRQYRGRPDGALRGAAGRSGGIRSVTRVAPSPAWGKVVDEAGRMGWGRQRDAVSDLASALVQFLNQLGLGPHPIRHASRDTFPLREKGAHRANSGATPSRIVRRLSGPIAPSAARPRPRARSIGAQSASSERFSPATAAVRNATSAARERA